MDFDRKEIIMEIKAKRPTQDELDSMGIRKWPIWEKEESNFDWYYDEKETCFFIEGKVEIELPGGKIVSLGKGDLAIFPKGLSCKWHIKEKVRKHYNFG